MGTLDHIIGKFGLGARMGEKLPIFIPEFTRDDLALLFAELDFTRGAEVGVEWGRYSEILCKANPFLSLYCVDSWKQDELYRTDQKIIDGYYQTALEKLTPYGCRLIRKASVDAVGMFQEGFLDFVYIDGAHDYDNVMLDLKEWSRIVRPGGIVAGHDYKHYKNTNVSSGKWGVVKAVKTYTRVNKIAPWFIFGTKGSSGEFWKCPKSWLFVKE